MATVSQLRLIEDFSKFDIGDFDVAELQEEINGMCRPRSDPLDVSRDLRLLASKDLHETPEIARRNIDKLRKMIQDDETLNARLDDIFLSAFLRARKHDVDKAFTCIKNYYEFKYRYPNFYTYCLPHECSEPYKMGHFGAIPGHDRFGRKLCVVIPSKLDLDRSPLHETFQMGTTNFELNLEDPDIQIAGIAVIVDLKELTIMQQARLITPSLAWHLAIIVQDKMPIRMKAVHVVNQPFYFNAIYAVFRPFLKKKLRKRIFLHGKDMSSLHKHIDPEMLPEDWGGKKPPYTNRCMRAFITMNEHKFKEWKQYSYVEPEGK
uniref:CRAL-TRIO domain-containing protein n=1 Tax=Clastoptera arizonana TaxID=38151 RepID=A0A1B6CIH5_9HEMI